MKVVRLTRAALALAALTCLAGPARAQGPAPVPSYYPGYNPYYQSGLGVGGALTGAANLTNAAGNYQIQTEQARIAQQQYEQSRLQTQRMTFDQMNYERENTKTRAEEMERITSATVRRMLTEAPTQEILLGTTLNEFSKFIRRLTDQSVFGPMVALEPSQVSQLEVAPPGGTIINSGLGMVANWDNAPWPLSLYNAKKDIDPLVRAVIYKARARDLDPKTYDQCKRKIQSYQDNLYKMLTPGKVDSGGYFEASTFLTSLDNSLSLLRQPDAYKYFAGDYVAKGGNVLDLVLYVTGNGLKFIPARPEHGSAYISTHYAMVSYIRGAEGTQSFMTKIGNPKDFGKFGGNN
jgi:hypothetical protein